MSPIVECYAGRITMSPREKLRQFIKHIDQSENYGTSKDRDRLYARQKAEARKRDRKARWRDLGNDDLLP